jgi:lysophospholipase L1-like esterase
VTAGVLAITAVLVSSSSGPAASSATGAAIVAPASGSLQPAVRLGRRVCQRVVIIGDSLTVGAEPHHRAQLVAAGIPGIVDGNTSRRIPAMSTPQLSGVLTAERIRREWGDADCWVIALGNNDIASVASMSSSTAATLVAQLVAAVSPGARVWWVNVRDVRTAELIAKAATFNGVLDARAASDAAFEVVDWASLVAANPAWSTDGIHVTATGYRARAALVAAAIAP